MERSIRKSWPKTDWSTRRRNRAINNWYLCPICVTFKCRREINWHQVALVALCFFRFGAVALAPSAVYWFYLNVVFDCIDVKGRSRNKGDGDKRCRRETKAATREKKEKQKTRHRPFGACIWPDRSERFRETKTDRVHFYHLRSFIMSDARSFAQTQRREGTDARTSGSGERVRQTWAQRNTRGSNSGGEREREAQRRLGEWHRKCCAAADESSSAHSPCREWLPTTVASETPWRCLFCSRSHRQEYKVKQLLYVSLSLRSKWVSNRQLFSVFVFLCHLFASGTESVFRGCHLSLQVNLRKSRFLISLFERITFAERHKCIYFDRIRNQSCSPESIAWAIDLLSLASNPGEISRQRWLTNTNISTANIFDRKYAKTIQRNCIDIWIVT